MERRQSTWLARTSTWRLSHNVPTTAEGELQVIQVSVAAAEGSAAAESLEAALRDCDIVMSALGGPTFSEHFLLSSAARNVAHAFQSLRSAEMATGECTRERRYNVFWLGRRSQKS